MLIEHGSDVRWFIADFVYWVSVHLPAFIALHFGVQIALKGAKIFAKWTKGVV